MRKYASAEEHAAKKTENDSSPFWLYGESIRTSVHGLHIVMWKQMPSWECRFLRRAIAVEAR